MSSIIAEAKVGMLGHSGSGKTCFMYGMYSAFGNFSRKLDFTLFTKDDDDDAAFRDIWEAIEAGQFPVGNPEDILTYNFELRNGFDPLIDISWIDYRGQVLRGRSGDPEVDAVKEQVKDSDCLFLCVELRTLESDEARETNKIARLAALTKDMPRVPLVILLTKADESMPNEIAESSILTHKKPPIRAHGQADEKDTLPPIDPEMERVTLERFAPWFQQGRPIMICPVSIKRDHVYYKYLPAPFAFTTYKIVQKKHAEMSALLRLDNGHIEKRTAHFRSLFGKRTTEELRESIRNHEQSLSDFEKKTSLLENYLSRASIYENGQRVVLSNTGNANGR